MVLFSQCTSLAYRYLYGVKLHLLITNCSNLQNSLASSNNFFHFNLLGEFHHFVLREISRSGSVTQFEYFKCRIKKRKRNVLLLSLLFISHSIVFYKQDTYRHNTFVNLGNLRVPPPVSNWSRHHCLYHEHEPWQTSQGI